MNFIQAHQTIIALLSYYIASAFVSSLPAPTSQSTPLYTFLFKFVNTLAANVARAYSAQVEKSPNFQDAVNLQQAVQGQEQTPVVLPPPKP